MHDIKQKYVNKHVYMHTHGDDNRKETRQINTNKTIIEKYMWNDMKGKDKALLV